MKTNRILYTILCLTSIFAASCHSEKDEPDPLPQTGFRTVLVYMAANNNLGQYSRDRDDLEEMKTAARSGDTGSGHLVVYNAGYNSDPVLVEVTRGGLDTLKVYNRDVMSVEASRMSAVFADVQKLAPADDYGLVLWSHGTGWLRDGIDGDTGRRRSFGDETVGGIHYTMNTSTLAEAIASAPFRFSFLYFDCCFMMSVETLYELRNAVPLVAGSVTELPAEGMPYDINVRRFFNKPEADVKGAAKNTFEYFEAQPQASSPYSMSVVSTAGMEKLAKVMKNIYENCGGGVPKGYSPQYFCPDRPYINYYFDLRDYVHALCDNANRADLKSEFDAAFGETVLYSDAPESWESGWKSIDLRRTNGISTYILTDDSSAATGDYKGLSWYADVASAIQF